MYMSRIVRKGQKKGYSKKLYLKLLKEINSRRGVGFSVAIYIHKHWKNFNYNEALKLLNPSKPDEIYICYKEWKDHLSLEQKKELFERLLKKSYSYDFYYIINAGANWDYFDYDKALEVITDPNLIVKSQIHWKEKNYEKAFERLIKLCEFNGSSILEAEKQWNYKYFNYKKALDRLIEIEDYINVYKAWKRWKNKIDEEKVFNALKNDTRIFFSFLEEKAVMNITYEDFKNFLKQNILQKINKVV